MRSHLYRAAVFALYQFSLLVGIAMMPMALAMRKLGVTLPVHRIVSRFGEAYQRASAKAA